MSYQRGAGYGDGALQQPSRSPPSSSLVVSPSASSGNENGDGPVHSHSHSHGHASTSPPEIPDRSHRRAASISRRTSYSRPPGSSSHLQPSTSALSASPEAPSTLRRMPKSAVYNDLASTARGSSGDPPQTSYSTASSQFSTPKFGAPREYQPDSPLTPTMASQTLPSGASGASHRDRDRTPFATPDRSIYANPSASTDISAISRSREASVSSDSSLKTGTTPKPLHEPPILMPSSILKTAGSRSHLSYPTVHSSGSSVVSESYDNKSDTDSAESYGWSGLDDSTLQHEPTKSPLFGEEASGSGYTNSVLMRGVTTARLRTPSPPASRSGMRRTRSISKSDAVDGDPAAWWTSPGSGKRSSLMSLKATDLGTVRAETPAAVPEEIEIGQTLNSFGIAYIPPENINSGARLSTYEPQRPSSARSRATTPDYLREQSPSRPSESAAVPEQAAACVQDSSPLSDPSLAPPFVERPQVTTRQQPLSSNRSVERPALLGPKSSSSGSDELVIPPKSPNRQPCPSLQRDASSQSLSESVGVLSLASPTTSTMVDTSPQVGGSPNSQAVFAERKAKRQVSAPAPRPQKSRHRASASLVGKHKFDHETKTLAPMSTQADVETASPSSGQVFELGAAERIAARPTLTMLSSAEPRFSVGRGQLDEPPMSASDFALSYGEFDAVTPIENHEVDQDEEPSTRTSHVRSPAVADEPIAMDLAPSSPSQPTAATLRLATVATPTASSKRTPTRSESPKDGIQNPASLYSQLTDTIADAANLEHDLYLVEVGSAAAGPTPSEREPFRSASRLQLIDRPGSVAGLSDVNSARASSPGFSSEDVFHDATAEDGMMSDVRRRSTGSDVSTVPAPASITPLGLGSVKLDAKARAAAFVADLKRARTAASGSSNGDPPVPSSPLMASPMTTPVMTSDSLGITVSSTSPTTYVEPESPREVLILEGHNDSGRSQRLDAKPSSPARASPANGPPSFSTDTPRPLTPQVFVGEESLSSQSALPPAQLLAPNSGAISISDRTPLAPSTTAGLPARYDSPPLAAPEPPPPSPPRLMLRRRRLLPPSLQIINDLRRTRTAGERANLYAMKIRELRKETSGIATWVGFIQHGVHERMSAQTVSQLPRHSRDEGSSASFPTRPDATCARELPPGSFTRQDLVPTVPFPGVLGAVHHSPSSSLPGMSSPPSSSSSTARFSTSQLLSSTSLSMRPASAIKDKAYFFTSLGRRGSRRESASAAVPTSSTSVAPPPRRLSVSAPFNAGPTTTTTTTALTSAVPFSSVRSAGAVAGPRPIGGASSLHPGPNGGITTSSAPIPVSAASPVLSISSNVASKTSHESLNGTTNRTSFINVGGQSAVSEAMNARTELLGEEREEEDDEETKEKIQRLVDILPYARPEQIRSALRRANGDDVLAISIFLSDDQE
ncbi:BZ3500_MvSof-1268-A1-R1_Chr1-2g01394 [Microbotryum saponariae]|uniref:BZ3500_MvSof-1268-A1-R1_Chr1-2g01394 protein n=1 Tax=Microbotryum saponariae TaxID=289078 RepID=A0A2X0KK56_9BASI|nr:BZ3500_MvSof-1268-A1-R1_Chr1-2g01394 [Microbotryum saponariae]SCZ97306.1 BZ3501_MvSof-1269-A2-R1_Chr1-2g00993 [Microbotryum saponariae]